MIGTEAHQRSGLPTKCSGGPDASLIMAPTQLGRALLYPECNLVAHPSRSDMILMLTGARASESS